ncbi:MAG: hypothetical protein AAGC81_06300 [Pseudomonadota bacterium]
MADDAIALYERDPLGLWQEVGVAYPDSDDFGRQIAWLKSQAGPTSEVVVWVPAELIEHHELELTARRSIDKRFLAGYQIAQKDQVGPETVEIALGKSDKPNTIRCLSLATQNRKEAEAYARKWGFQPIQVTARAPGAGFPENPVFERPETKKSRTVRRTLGSLALIGSIVTTTGLSAAIVWAIMLSGHSPVVVRPDLPDLNLTLIDQTDPLPQATVAVGDGLHDTPVQTDRIAQPSRGKFAFSRPSSGTEWISKHDRSDTSGFSSPTLKSDRLVLGAPLAGQSVPVAILASLTAPLAAIETVDPVVETSLETPAPTAQEAEVDDQVVAANGPFPVPIPRPKRAASAQEVEDVAASTPEPTPEIVIVQESAGIATSPRPVPRPLGSEARFAAAKTLVPRTARTTGTRKLSVTRAAKREGLPLNRTSLIGIINVQSGREALLRLSNGRIQRVARGEVVQGWSVRLIGQDAVRLERGDETHTLILVTR